MVAAAGYISLETLSAKVGSDCVLSHLSCCCAVCDYVAVLALATVYLNSLNNVEPNIVAMLFGSVLL